MDEEKLNLIGLKGGDVEVAGGVEMVADRSGGDQKFECLTMQYAPRVSTDLKEIMISFMCYLIIKRVKSA